MSGIVGVCAIDGHSIDPTFIKTMLASLAHKGPDGKSAWHESSIALGHLMLRTTPESLFEKLPLASKTGNLILTADARIDNFDDVPECDERPFIKAVLQAGHFQPHFVHADQVSPVADLSHIWQFEDEAFVGPNHFLPWQLNRKAQEVGIRVFLDGFDGDTTVCHGVLRLKELASAGEWASFKNEAKALSQHFDCSPQHLLHQYGLPTLLDLTQEFRWIAFARAVHQIHEHFPVSRKQIVWQYGLQAFHPKHTYRWWPHFSLAELTTFMNLVRADLSATHQQGLISPPLPTTPCAST